MSKHLIPNPFEQVFWPCFTDIMAGLFALVLLVLIASLIQQSGLASQLKSQQEEFAKVKKENQRLEEELQEAVKSGLITIKDGHINIEGNILFPTGSSKVSEEGKVLLKKLAMPLRHYISESPDMIMVSGFTDDIGIHNLRFPSNWELSAARAVEVVKLLIAEGVPREKIFAAGFGEFHPIVANRDERDRRRNRRVEISRVPIRLPEPALPERTELKG
ncbi:MAG: OmpA family protein [bacterium]